MVKVEVEKHPEIAEAKAATLKAMKEAEAGWQTVINKIGELELSCLPAVGIPDQSLHFDRQHAPPN